MSIDLAHLAPAFAFAVTAFAFAPSARADAAGDNVLASMDAALNKSKTSYFEWQLTVDEPGKAEKTLGLSEWDKGSKRLFEFTSPADMKGTKLLEVAPDQIYVYLPAFGKVRRVSTSVADQGLFGLAFGIDELTTTTYAASYTATIASDTATEWKLTATAKTGQTPVWPKIAFTISKDRTLPTELKYFNAAGVNVKTETRTGYTCSGASCTPSEKKMVDNVKAGLSTKMVRKTWKVDGAISDDMFSKTKLGS